MKLLCFGFDCAQCLVDSRAQHTAAFARGDTAPYLLSVAQRLMHCPVPPEIPQSARAARSLPRRFAPRSRCVHGRHARRPPLRQHGHGRDRPPAAAGAGARNGRRACLRLHRWPPPHHEWQHSRPYTQHSTRHAWKTPLFAVVPAARWDYDKWWCGGCGVQSALRGDEIACMNDGARIP